MKKDIILLFFKNIIFILLVPLHVSTVIPLFLLAPPLSAISSLWVISILPLLLGYVICFKCFWDFFAIGQGTPFPLAPPKKLVIKGFYRFVRNPMYVGVLLIIFGFALLYSSFKILIYGLIIFILFNLFIVLYEEKTLEKRFGLDYLEYKKNVPRWIPKINKT